MKESWSTQNQTKEEIIRRTKPMVKSMFKNSNKAITHVCKCIAMMVMEIFGKRVIRQVLAPFFAKVFD